MTNEFIDTQEQSQKLQKVLDELKSVPGSAMMVMQKAQEIYGYLPKEVQIRIADALNVPLEEIYGIATFYAQFHLKPRGKYTIGICMGTACYVKNSAKILDKVQTKLNITPGQTTPDHKYTLEATRCIGCCGLAPVLTVGEDVYGNLKEDDVEVILSKYND